jgi:hypothetical protein
LKDGVFSTDLTNLEAADKVFVAAKPSARPPPPKPPPSQPPRLQPASDELIEKCINKGCLLDWSMRHNDNEVGPYYVPPRMTAQSPYLSWSDLQTWFWHNYPTDEINPVYDDLYAHWGIGWVLEELGVSAYTDIYEGGKNRITSIVHSDPYTEDINAQHYEVNGQRYRATGADYIMALNTEEGVIIGMNREGPAEASKERRPPLQANEMPQLNQFSDVCWIAWLELAKHNGHDPRNLRYFISISIINVETRSVVRRIMVEKHLGLDYWPGATFESGTPEFDAILGKLHLFRKFLQVNGAVLRSCCAHGNTTVLACSTETCRL